MPDEKDEQRRKAAEEARKKAAEAEEARLAKHDEKVEKQTEETEKTLEKERSGKAEAKAHNETAGQRRQQKRAEGKANEGQDKMHTLRNPQTGEEMEVSQIQWKAEGQTLRQLGFERADVLEQANPGGDEGATGEPGSEGGGDV